MVARSIVVHAALAAFLVTTLPRASAQMQGSRSNGGGSKAAAPSAKPSDLPTDPATGLLYVPDPNQGGNAASLRIVRVSWGRLVDVYDQAASGVRHRRYADFLIGPSIRSNGADYLLEKNAVTLQETLTILHPANSASFKQALTSAEDATVPVLDKGLGGLPPWTMVARNGALSIQLDDLLDAATIDEDTVRLLTGYPPATPFELRVLRDPSHGALKGGVFQSTRVLLDLTVTQLEAQQSGLPVNLLGLPPAVTTSQPNGILRLPTQLSPPAGQFEILRNLAGNGLAFNGNGSNDPTSPTLDVVRAFRSGGPSNVTGDPYDGFLPDDAAPEVIGVQPVAVTFVGPPPGVAADGKTIDFTFATASCASQPLPGDVVQLPNHIVQVTQAAAPPVAGSVQGVRIRVLVGNPATLAPSAGLFKTTWDPAGLAPPECFVRYSPLPASPPNAGVPVSADVRVTFSEPMRANSVTALESFVVEYGANPSGSNPIYERVVGNVVPTLDLVDFTFAPLFPLRNTQASEAYTVLLDGGAGGVVDLAGNALANPLPPVPFTLDPKEPQVDSLGISLVFSSPDEDGNGAPELRGQFIPDYQAGVIHSRSLSRFSAQADPSQPIVGAMVPLPLPVTTPLSQYGSKMMGLWRYPDLGFNLLDDATHNLDVEGLWWEPFGGAVLPDQFDEFQMSLGDSAYLPDEDLSTGLLPNAPASGIVNTFDQNYLGGASSVVHPKPLGYSVNPLDVSLSPSGRAIAPWPMNRNVPPSQFSYWTWRDTGVQDVAGPNGFGVDPRRLVAVSGSLPGVGFYPVNLVPTIGLPLLMEFRTYPSASASGSNGFQIAIAINSSARPSFRTFSTGGVLPNGQTIVVDPDQQVVGTGGVNPFTGATTAPQDNAFYYGQADFVVRVSRLHTIWFDALGATQAAAVVTEPLASRLPPGTQVVLAFRGASAITSQTAGTWEDASNLDPYGDSYTPLQHLKLGHTSSLSFTPTFFPAPGDHSWTTSVAPLGGARYFQARVTLIGDPLTGLTPELSGLGLALLR